MPQQDHSPTAAPAASQHEAPLKDKTVLFLDSGPARKRFILQRARQLGVRVVLLQKENNWANRYADHCILADPADPESCVAEVEKYLAAPGAAGAIDGAVTFWEEDILLLARLCERFGWPGQSVAASLNARNKLRTREALKHKSLQKYSVPFARISSLKELEQALSKIHFPAVLKPAWGASSQFVVKVETLAEARNAFEYVQSNLSPKFDPIYAQGTDILLEEYLDGAEVNVDLLLQDGQIRFHAVTDNFPKKEPFFVDLGDAMPSRHEGDDLRALLRMSEKVLAAIGLSNGAVHLEARISAEGPKLLEVNARMGGNYLHDWVKTVWGVDLIEESLKVAVGLPCHPQGEKEPRTHLVSRFLIAESSGTISGISDPEPGDPDRGPEKIHDITLLKEIGDAVLVPPEGFESIGWVVGKGPTYAEAEENLEAALKKFDISIARFDSTSSIGKTRRRNRFSSAQVARRRILQSARLERIRGVSAAKPRSLHVGVLCNRFEETASGGGADGADESAVHQDLTSVGLNIKSALEAKGHRVTFFDMNETPLPFDKLADGNVDLIFNVCERINNSSLLEPHAAAILDCLGIPYTGSNPLTLALCIDKIKVKKVLSYHGIPTPKFDYAFDPEEAVRDDLRYPLIVKPANTDNSIGITNDSVVTTPTALRERIAYVTGQLKRPALIEEFVDGEEVDVSIMGNAADVKVLPLSRSIFADLPKEVWPIYPFQAKWSHDSVYSKIRTERPARYSQKLTQLISEITLDVYNIFDCHDYARVEVRVDKDGNPFVLEVNPNPSINRGDCVPACAELIGLDYEGFIDELLKSAIARYQAKPPYYHLQSSLIAL